MSDQDLISLLVVAFIFIIILAGAFIVIQKRWISRKSTMYGAQFTAQSLYLQYQNQQKKKEKGTTRGMASGVFLNLKNCEMADRTLQLSLVL